MPGCRTRCRRPGQLDGAPYGQVGERERRSMDAGDVIGRRRLAGLEPPVRGDQDLVVRHDPDEKHVSRPSCSSTRPRLDRRSSGMGAIASAASAAVTGRLSTKSRMSVPSGPWPASLRACTTRSAVPDTTGPVTPRAWRSRSPVKPVCAQDLAELCDHAWIVERERAVERREVGRGHDQARLYARRVASWLQSPWPVGSRCIPGRVCGVRRNSTGRHEWMNQARAHHAGAFWFAGWFLPSGRSVASASGARRPPQPRGSPGEADAARALVPSARARPATGRRARQGRASHQLR